MKRGLRHCILTAALAVYPLCAFAQTSSEDTTVVPLKAPGISSAPGEATIAPDMALKQPDAALRTQDQMDATSLVPAPQAQLAPFRPTMGTGAYLAAKAAVERSPATVRPAFSQPLAPPTLKLSIEGDNQGTGGGYYPPDTEGATGIKHFVEVTNSHVDIYLKSNGTRVKSVSLASFLGYFTKALFDPRVVYDRTWNRWVITAEAFPESSTVQRYFFAISTTSDPTGSFFIYNLNATQFAGTNNFFDFPQLGLDQDAVLFTGNVFSPSSFLGPRLFAVAKARLYNGLGFYVPVFGPGNSFGTLAPPIVLDQDAKTYIASARPSGNTLQLFTLRDSSRAFGATLSAASDVPVNAYSVPGSAVQPASGNTNRLDSGDSRFVNTGTQNGGFVWQVHTIDLSGFAAVRWYKINAVTNSVAISRYQFQSGNSSDFNASIAANDSGDVYLTWSSSSPSVFPQVIFNGERSGNIPPTAGTVLFTSSAALTGNFDSNFGLQRWGDYSAVTVDPTNALRAGVVNEKVNSSSVWGSRIGLIGF
jgi:hypothetical protein